MTRPSFEQFLEDVSTHQLTVNLDQGVFRDLTLMKPNSVDRHFNITSSLPYRQLRKLSKPQSE